MSGPAESSPSAVLWPHHWRTVERLTARFGSDPRFEALIIGGSLAKGYGREDSDVDVVFVATPEEYRRREATGDFGYFSQEDCDYAGGYVDGKVVDLAFLGDVAERGSEPARAAFVGAFPAFSHLPELPGLLARITAYPEGEREAKMHAFYSQLLIMNWYIGEAEKRSDPYLLRHVSTELALYAGRLLLAHNRVLYPYHKWFLRRVEEAPDKPEGFMDALTAVLNASSKATAQALLDCLDGFHDWNVSFERATACFLREREWNWRTGRAPLEDW